MFQKEIRVKSNNQIKSSEKKTIIKDILAQYPSINEDELKNLIKVKDSEITLTKINTSENADVFVYIIDKIPYLFRIDKEDKLLPTVYFLWKFPNILLKFYTPKPVFNKLLNGADLMLPGIIVDGEVNLYTFKGIQKNQLCCVCLDDNSAPIAIGRTALSGEDMYMSAMRGRGVAMIHIFKDQLWAMGDQSVQMPFIPKPETGPVVEEKNQPDESEKQSVAGAIGTATSEVDAVNLEKLEIEETQESEILTEPEELKLDDELLKTVFYAALKFKSKDLKLPVIVSTFTKVLQECCPKGVTFDLKQTSYKKISVFLKEMVSLGCIHMKEQQKGVLAISKINKEYEPMKFLRRPLWLERENMEETIAENVVLDVIEMHKIDANTEELFRKHYRKGDVLSPQEVRQFVMNYVKDENLQSKDNKKMVNLDPILTKVLKAKYDSLSFEELFSDLFSKLSPMHCIVHKYSDNKEREPPILKKGKFKPIVFKLESRGGNKKLTVVHHLNEFQLDPKELSQKIRTQVGCSVSFDFLNSTTSDEYTITVQGNQINQVSRLLKSEYGIQLKHMNGLDLGVKE